MPQPIRLNQRPLLSTEALALCVSVFFALACNGRFFAATMAGRAPSDTSTWLFAAAMGVMLVALHTLLVWWARIKPRTWGRALLWRLGALVAAAVATLGALLLVFQDFGSLMRNQKELRYLITPAAAL